jgi:hypothetical protein
MIENDAGAIVVRVAETGQLRLLRGTAEGNADHWLFPTGHI